MRASVGDDYAKKKDRYWTVWYDFCVQYDLDPFLRHTTDPVPYLQIFGDKYRRGELSLSGKAVASRTVEDALRLIGQTYTRMGTPGTRKDATGGVDYRIYAQLRGYGKSDKPPSRVKPCPISVVIDALRFAYHDKPNAERKAIANMICAAFCFCLRPGDYTGTTTDDQPFRLDDLVFFLGQRRLSNATATDYDIENATAVHLIFTTQKNGIKGDVIAHARSRNPSCCPVTSLSRQFMTHRMESRRRDLPYDGWVILATYYNLQNVRVPIKASQVTSRLRWHAGVLQPTTGIDPAMISAHSLRAGGAMSLLTSGCHSDVIKLMARWHSDAMMRYLHQQSLPVFRNLATSMFNHGTHSFLPEHWVPSNSVEPSGSPAPSTAPLGAAAGYKNT
jgi:hypothetical protein